MNLVSLLFGIMATARFVVVSNKDVNSFSKQQANIKKSVIAVRKKNGNAYEPSSIRAFIQGIDCYLRKKKKQKKTMDSLFLATRNSSTSTR